MLYELFTTKLCPNSPFQIFKLCFLLRFFYIYFYVYECEPEYMSVYHMCVVPVKVRGTCQIPIDGDIDSWATTMGAKNKIWFLWKADHRTISLGPRVLILVV